MYKIAVLDVDGTLTDNAGKFSKRTVDVIGKLSKKNIPVCLCTGRNVKHALSAAKKLKLKNIISCVDGAVIVDSRTGKVVKENVLSNEITTKVLDILSKIDVYVEIVTSDRYYKFIRDKKFNEYNYTGQSFKFIRFVEYFLGARYIKDISRFNSSDEKVYQIIVAGNDSDLEKVKQEIKSIGVEIAMLDNLWPNYLFLHAYNARKIDGLKFLCQYYNVTTKEAVAIGDQFNDLDLIEEAGMGIAMGNAIDEVKSIADDITLNNIQDGAAVALKKYFDVD